MALSLDRSLAGCVIALGWLVAMSVGCRSRDLTKSPLGGHIELCCRSASDDHASFRGCRATNKCWSNEPVWVRGPLMCGPVEAETCEGARCCSLDVVDRDSTTVIDRSATGGGPEGLDHEQIDLPAAD